jgi:hypothetical protein
MEQTCSEASSEDCSGAFSFAPSGLKGDLLHDGVAQNQQWLIVFTFYEEQKSLGMLRGA